MTTAARAPHKVDPQRSAGAKQAARTLRSEHAQLRKHNPRAYKAYLKRMHKIRHVAAIKAAQTRKVNKARGLSTGVECCAAEALAASLRLTGVTVTEDDVLALYWRTARHADQGASLADTLAEAQRSGLAGIRPVSYAPVDDIQHMCLLGVELPGSHAVLHLGDNWASWGGLHLVSEFPDAVIEEAWELTWETSRK